MVKTVVKQKAEITKKEVKNLVFSPPIASRGRSGSHGPRMKNRKRAKGALLIKFEF